MPGVNFTNVLQATFTREDPKSTIKLLNLTVFFALLGSARVKAARRILVKLTPDLRKDRVTSIPSCFTGTLNYSSTKFTNYEKSYKRTKLLKDQVMEIQGYL